MCAAMFGCEIYHMMKGSKFKLLDEGREVCVIDPALKVTQPELKGKHQGHPPWVAQQHES